MSATLIAPLASGISGAASGTAEIYTRGTSIAAAAFSDWDCNVQETTHTLDANGGVTRYVESEVDVIVKDSQGSTLRTFTWTVGAPMVTIENAAVTGVSPTGATGTGAGYRSDLNTYLSSVYESFGAADGKVLVNGLPQNVKGTIGSTTGVMFNASVYGATGNGSTDDLSSIQAAINACQSAGGGIVYLPSPSVFYKINGTLVIGNSNVMLWAPTANTVLKQAGSASNWLSITASNVVVQGLGFSATTTGYTGIMVSVGTSAKNIRLVGCQFNGSNAAAVSGGTDVGITNNVIDGCYFLLSEASGLAVNTSPGSWAVNNSFVEVTAATLNNIFRKSTFQVTNSRVYVGSNASPTVLELAGGLPITFTGNTIDNEGSGIVSILSDPSAVAASSVIWESGNSIRNGGSGSVSISAGLKVFSGSQMIAQSRNTKVVTSNSATSYVADTRIAYHEVISNGAGMAFSNPTSGIAAPGLELTLWYKNTTGGPITPTFGTQFKANSVAVASNGAACWRFMYNSTSAAWDMIGGTPASYTP